MIGIERVERGIAVMEGRCAVQVSLAERARQAMGHRETSGTAGDRDMPVDEITLPVEDPEIPEEEGESGEEPSEEEIALRLALARAMGRVWFQELVFFSSEEESGIPELSIDI